MGEELKEIVLPETMGFSSHVDYGWFVVFTLEDSGGNVTHVTYGLRVVADVATPAYALYYALKDMTSSAITLIVVEWRSKPPAYAGAESYSQIEARASLRVRDEDSAARKYTMHVPSPRPEIFLTTSGDGANVVDPENAEVLAFLAEFADTGNGYLPNGKTISGMHTGKRITKKSNRG